MQSVQDIAITCNFYAQCREHGKVVPGSQREGHNVFTTTGRDWLAHLCAWQAIGSPDIPFTNRRLRWMGVGSGSQLEVEGVTGIVTPLPVSTGIYLAPIQTVQFPAPGKIAEIFREFATNELTFSSNTLVEISEAGLFVDVFPVSSAGGVEDSAVNGTYDTTLNPTIPGNAPVAYHAFEPVSKTADVSFEVRWEFRF